MTVDLTIEDSHWNSLNLLTLADAAVQATLDAFQLDPDQCEISVLACDDARITTLNADFRDKPTATNVLSWPTTDLSPDTPGARPPLPSPDFTGEIALGDIAIAFETCMREAQDLNKPVADHVTHLIIHGLLHLLGYDHIRDLDATLMEQIEIEILGRMGLEDPYRIRHGA